MNCSEAKRISIIDFLAKLGYYSIKVKQNDHYYLSPLRNEKDPSFRVNMKLNVWYDYGLGKGGTIIDLGTILLNCTIERLLERLESSNFSPVQRNYIYSDSSIKIKETKRISNPSLIAYLYERDIKKEIAQIYCVEVDFEMNGKLFYAIGFQNISKGFELRNKYFKGSSSPKDISLITNKSDKLCLFEGFFDFLSYFDSKFEMPGLFDFLVLNSISFLEKSIEIITRYKEVYIFLDNDHAGSTGAKRLLGLELNICIDKSKEYKNYKDLNEYRVADKRNKKDGKKEPPIKDRGLGL